MSQWPNMIEEIEWCNLDDYDPPENQYILLASMQFPFGYLGVFNPSKQMFLKTDLTTPVDIPPTHFCKIPRGPGFDKCWKSAP